jgi:hypothetical protein
MMASRLLANQVVMANRAVFAPTALQSVMYMVTILLERFKTALHLPLGNTQTQPLAKKRVTILMFLPK